jgi:mannan endo-1,4-beta-mannosidase
MVLRVARDMGLKVIVPLAGSGTACATPAGDAICVYAQAHGAPGAAFFSDIAVRTDFLAGVATMLAHVDPMTGRATRDDPTILAWENCIGCGAGQNAGAVSAWSEQVGHAIKLVDPHHLYESGAFAGRIAPSAADPVPATIFATTSVDIVGDALATGSDVEVARTRLDAVANLVVSTGKPYVLDSIGWSPSIWKTPADLDLWLTAIVRQRNVTGALAGDLEGHEDAGGFLPAPPANPAAGVAALYFPGIRTADMDAAEMRVRGRALRRLAYGMADITILPAYLLPPKPEIIGAAGDRLTWRGSAGAERYTIERSPDPSALGSWTVVCDACVTDLSGGWQDKAVPAGPAWYRITPENINGHKSVPSDPIQATR